MVVNEVFNVSYVYGVQQVSVMKVKINEMNCVAFNSGKPKRIQFGKRYLVKSRLTKLKNSIT